MHLMVRGGGDEGDTVTVSTAAHLAAIAFQYTLLTETSVKTRVGFVVYESNTNNYSCLGIENEWLIFLSQTLKKGLRTEI